MFSLREYRAEDLPTLGRIDRSCFPPGIAYSREELEFFVRRRGAFTLVAERDSEIAGFLIGHVLRTRAGNKVGHIITIDVVSQYRRGGLGTLLMRAGEHHMREAGCEAVYLETAVDNSAAIAFYQRHGFAVLSTIPRYYLDSLDALRMGKRLDLPAAAQTR